MAKQVRIGIDVGGTFTDAIALDNSTYEIIGIKKVPTTHGAKEGVIRGVIDVLHGLLEDIKISPDDVVFIAHGTTQATNALLEGDVADIAILGMAKGMIGFKAKIDTQIGDVSLADGKKIRTTYQFLNTANGVDKARLAEIGKTFQDEGMEVAVCAEAFSVDDPASEMEAGSILSDAGMIVTASNEISKLYGLRARTRTAVINASILPKMMQTANMTSQAVKDSRIQAPMMIMRSDGGVMQMDEVKKRPLLTVLSGPAAGVAGALMYEKISDGIFLEVGGTSTDISAIQNGKVITKYAKIGGHSTYVTSLDINTVGIAGGSVVRVKDKEILDVGPRSAHIAGLDYAVYADPEILRRAEATTFQAKHLDNNEYLGVRASDKCYAVTATCAANYLGFVPEGDYARAPRESAEILFERLSAGLGAPAADIARKIMDLAAAKVVPAIEDFIKEYNLNRDYLVLTGGGGGASTIVPAVAEKLGLKSRVARNAPVISTIGAALAMVRDSVERTIVNPTKEDIMRIRSEAEQAAIKAGAAPGTIQVTIDIDTAKSIVKATAVGATDLSANNDISKSLGREELEGIAVRDLGGGVPDSVAFVFENDILTVFSVAKTRKILFGLLNERKTLTCVLDRQGVIKLVCENAITRVLKAATLLRSLTKLLEDHAVYDEAGQSLPDVFLLLGGKIVDFSGLETADQVASLAQLEVEGMDGEAKVFVIIKRRGK